MARTSFRLALPLLLVLGSCAHEEVIVGQPEIRFQESSQRLIGLARVFADGEHVGWARTYAVDGPAGAREIVQVSDPANNTIGYVDELGQAFRNTAHSGQQLVANHDDLARNVAAVLGIYNRRVRLVDEMPQRQPS